MKLNRYWMMACVGSLMGCSTPMMDSMDGDVDPPNETATQAVTTFTFDSTALNTAPAAVVPSTRLALTSLNETNIASRLLATTETPTRVQSVDTTTDLFRSASWEWEKNGLSGRVLAHSLKKVGTPIRLDPANLQKQAVDRVRAFGVGSGEIGRVLQRQVMAQDTDGTVVGTPKLHSHKTFIYRAINGVPVVGHRAVVSHAADGSVRKILTAWPPLAPQGHALRTRLTTKEIEARASAALAREGKTSGQAFLTWRYLPQLSRTGEVTLKLVASARLKGAPQADGTSEEARLIDVDVEAIQ